MVISLTLNYLGRTGHTSRKANCLIAGLNELTGFEIMLYAFPKITMSI